MSKKTTLPQSYLRLFHIAYTTPSIDLYIDDQKYHTDILYEDFTYYTPLTPGIHQVLITLHHNNETLYKRTVDLKKIQSYSLLKILLKIQFHHKIKSHPYLTHQPLTTPYAFSMH